MSRKIWINYRKSGEKNKEKSSEIRVAEVFARRNLISCQRWLYLFLADEQGLSIVSAFTSLVVGAIHARHPLMNRLHRCRQKEKHSC